MGKKPKAKVVKVPLPAQAALDFPDAILEKSRSKKNERLIEKHRQGKRLNALEKYRDLRLKYIAAQQKRVQKAKQSKETEREVWKEKRKDEQDQLYPRKV